MSSLSAPAMLLMVSSFTVEGIARRCGRDGQVWMGLAMFSGLLSASLGAFIGGKVGFHHHVPLETLRRMVDPFMTVSVPAGPILCSLWLWFTRGNRARPAPGGTVSKDQPAKGVTAEKGYFLLQTGRETGPFSLKELSRMKQRGEIAGDAEYKFGAGGSWMPVQKLSALLSP